jgi:hypothetical protein
MTAVKVFDLHDNTGYNTHRLDRMRYFIDTEHRFRKRSEADLFVCNDCVV